MCTRPCGTTLSVASFNVLLQEPLRKYVSCPRTLRALHSNTFLSWNERYRLFCRILTDATDTHNVSVVCLQEVSRFWWELDTAVCHRFHIFHIGTVAVLLRRDIFPDVGCIRAVARTIDRNGHTGKRSRVLPYTPPLTPSWGGGPCPPDSFLQRDRVSNHILSVVIDTRSVGGGAACTDASHNDECAASGAARLYLQVTSVHLPFQSEERCTPQLAAGLWGSVLEAHRYVHPTDIPPPDAEQLGEPVHIIAGDFNLSPDDDGGVRYRMVVEQAPLAHRPISVSTTIGTRPDAQGSSSGNGYTARSVFDGSPTRIDHIIATGEMVRTTVVPALHELIPLGERDVGAWTPGAWCSDHAMVIATVAFPPPPPVPAQLERA